MKAPPDSHRLTWVIAGPRSRLCASHQQPLGFTANTADIWGTGGTSCAGHSAVPLVSTQYQQHLHLSALQRCYMFPWWWR